MPTAHSVRVAALTVGASTKWVDNVLSHYDVAGVTQGVRGVERQLNDDALIALALCRLLSQKLGVPLAKAVAISNEVVSARAISDGTYTVAPGVTLRFELAEIERGIRDRVGDAIESVAHVRRGRPTLRPQIPE